MFIKSIFNYIFISIKNFFFSTNSYCAINSIVFGVLAFFNSYVFFHYFHGDCGYIETYHRVSNMIGIISLSVGVFFFLRPLLKNILTLLRKL